jgi:hypothetical protein
MCSAAPKLAPPASAQNDSKLHNRRSQKNLSHRFHVFHAKNSQIQPALDQPVKGFLFNSMIDLQEPSVDTCFIKQRGSPRLPFAGGQPTHSQNARVNSSGKPAGATLGYERPVPTPYHLLRPASVHPKQLLRRPPRSAPSNGRCNPAPK